MRWKMPCSNIECINKISLFVWSAISKAVDSLGRGIARKIVDTVKLIVGLFVIGSESQSDTEIEVRYGL